MMLSPFLILWARLLPWLGPVLLRLLPWAARAKEAVSGAKLALGCCLAALVIIGTLLWSLHHLQAHAADHAVQEARAPLDATIKAQAATIAVLEKADARGRHADAAVAMEGNRADAAEAVAATKSGELIARIATKPGWDTKIFDAVTWEALRQ
jgi:hypothetical protein